MVSSPTPDLTLTGTPPDLATSPPDWQGVDSFQLHG